MMLDFPLWLRATFSQSALRLAARAQRPGNSERAPQAPITGCPDQDWGSRQLPCRRERNFKFDRGLEVCYVRGGRRPVGSYLAGAAPWELAARDCGRGSRGSP